MLKPKEIQDYKRRLEKELKEVEDWLETHPKIPSKAELETYEERHQRNEAVLTLQIEYERKERKREDILSALKRIENGIFGICVDSHPDFPHEIEEGRLTADPAFSRCCPCFKALKLKAKSNRGW
jgi:RNA polymerase-binding transcription factor DksA